MLQNEITGSLKIENVSKILLHAVITAISYMPIFSPQKPPTHCEPNVNGAMTSPPGQTAASNGPTTTVQLTECSGMASTSSTSPNGGTHANHGSIEQASLNGLSLALLSPMYWLHSGSAPYTPSSVGSHAHSGIAQGIELSRTCNASAAADPVTSLNNLDASELIKFDQVRKDE